MKRINFLILFLFLVFSGVLFSQNIITSNLSSDNSFISRHSVYLGIGVKLNSFSTKSITPVGVSTETKAIGMIGYNYLFSNEWALDLSAGLFSAESNVGITGVKSINIIPVLIGLRYYPPSFKINPSARFWVGAKIGEFFSSGVKTDIISIFSDGVRDLNENVIAASVALGIDINAGSKFRLAPKITYFIVDKFSEVVGQRDNYSGISFLIDFGIIL